MIAPCHSLSRTPVPERKDCCWHNHYQSRLEGPNPHTTLCVVDRDVADRKSIVDMSYDPSFSSEPNKADLLLVSDPNTVLP